MKWSEDEDAVVLDNLSMPDSAVSQLLAEAGYDRSTNAVKLRRIGLGMAKHGPRYIRDAGWPNLRGSDEERDRRFVRAVMRAALEEGVFERAAR